jgi:hypothetical protein
MSNKGVHIRACDCLERPSKESMKNLSLRWQRTKEKAPAIREPGPGDVTLTLGKGKRGRILMRQQSPRCQANSYEHPERRTACAVGECRPMPQTRSRKVLVVDDHADGADSLAALLQILGHEA